ncbi:MAG: hypothetical protein QM820_01965 [Minicystis sp.]
MQRAAENALQLHDAGLRLGERHPQRRLLALQPREALAARRAADDGVDKRDQQPTAAEHD